MSNTDKQLTQEQLAEILDLHVKWLREESGGVQANLTGANLTGANLHRANLEGANLEGANLTNAILTNAILTNAILTGANLEEANMWYANLTGANLTGANLEDAILTEANLEGADLEYAILEGANLRRANLEGANLRRANLEGANLEYAILDGAKLPPPVIDLSNCNVGYKKVWNSDRSKRVVVELRFPEGTKLVSTVIGRKCRASEATVVRCATPGHENETEFRSMHDQNFIYRVGETVRPTKPFDDSITVECTSGIHFFTTQEEAYSY